MQKIELRCGNCRKLLGRIDGSAEIKCSRCGVLNIYDAKTRRQEVIPKPYRYSDRR